MRRYFPFLVLGTLAVLALVLTDVPEAAPDSVEVAGFVCISSVDNIQPGSFANTASTPTPDGNSCVRTARRLIRAGFELRFLAGVNENGTVYERYIKDNRRRRDD